MPERRKIAVAMSGGVDSSVAAAFLSREGHDVVGIGLKLADAREARCCGARDLDDARAVCGRLGIPFYAVNASEAFEREVVAPFCRSYASGLTPNPCAVCNVEIKFGHLLKLALAAGFDAVATGHYARVVRDRETGRFVLRRAKDRRQDQSYFLFGLKQDQLERAVFPLGEMSKAEVRRLAKRLDLRVHDKPQSRDVCFFRPGRLPEFLESRMPAAFRPGPILDVTGREVGRHDGCLCFTVGQRRGIGLALGRPVYVRKVLPDRNAVVVAQREELLTARVPAGGLNWAAWETPPETFVADAQIRYAHTPARATVTVRFDGTVDVLFDEPQFAPAPGQAAVFYDGQKLLGGGTILRAEESSTCVSTHLVADDGMPSHGGH